METIKGTAMKRSSSYEFTVSTADHQSIGVLRAYAKRVNSFRNSDGDDRRLRVKVRPRLGQNNPNARLYAKGGPLYRWCSMNIRKEHGTRFDVYLYEEIIWTKWLARKAAAKAALRAELMGTVATAVKKPTLIVDPAF